MIFIRNMNFTTVHQKQSMQKRTDKRDRDILKTTKIIESFIIESVVNKMHFSSELEKTS